VNDTGSGEPLHYCPIC